MVGAAAAGGTPQRSARPAAARASGTARTRRRLGRAAGPHASPARHDPALCTPLPCPSSHSLARMHPYGQVKSAYDYQFAKPALRWLFNDYFGEVMEPACCALDSWLRGPLPRVWGLPQPAAAGRAHARSGGWLALQQGRWAARRARLAAPRHAGHRSAGGSAAATSGGAAGRARPSRTARGTRPANSAQGVNSVLYFAPPADPRVSVKAKIGSADMGEVHRRLATDGTPRMALACGTSRARVPAWNTALHACAAMPRRAATLEASPACAPLPGPAGTLCLRFQPLGDREPLCFADVKASPRVRVAGPHRSEP